jgi:hypothetical protein
VVGIVKEEPLVLHEIAVAAGADLVIIHVLNQRIPGRLETMPEIHEVSTNPSIVRILSNPRVMETALISLLYAHLRQLWCLLGGKERITLLSYQAPTYYGMMSASFQRIG